QCLIDTIRRWPYRLARGPGARPPGTKPPSEIERAPAPPLASEPHPAVHQVHQLPADRESQTGSAEPARYGAISLAERLKDQVAMRWRDSYPCVGNREFQTQVSSRHEPVADREGTFGSEFQRSSMND